MYDKGIFWSIDSWGWSDLPEDWEEITDAANEAITRHYLEDVQTVGRDLAESRAQRNTERLWDWYCLYGLETAIRMLDDYRLPFEAPAEVSYD